MINTLDRSTSDELKFPQSKETTAVEMPFLSLKNLTKSFTEGSRQRFVLKQVNLGLQDGQITAILGQSGSGKSTLLNLISGIDLPDEGEIILKGENLTALSERERTLFRREHIGFVFQFFNLIPTLSVWDNVILPIELQRKPDERDLANVEDLLNSVEMLDRRKAYPDRLSGGEQQRVAIARALANDPLLLLADEPTGNLDEQTGQKVMILLDKLTRRSGKNLIMVTHSRRIAAQADQTYRLIAGKLEEETHPI